MTPADQFFAAPDERRGEGRTKALLSGKIRLGPVAVIDCVIRDLSSTGARLRVDEVAIIPECFELDFASAGLKRRENCRVVWRRPTEIGIAFD